MQGVSPIPSLTGATSTGSRVGSTALAPGGKDRQAQHDSQCEPRGIRARPYPYYPAVQPHYLSSHRQANASRLAGEVAACLGHGKGMEETVQLLG